MRAIYPTATDNTLSPCPTPMSSGYRRIESRQPQAPEEPTSEDARLVAAFDDESDSDNNSIGGWDDDRHIENSNSGGFAVGDYNDTEEYENAISRHPESSDLHRSSGDVDLDRSAQGNSATGPADLSRFQNVTSTVPHSSDSFLSTSRGLASNFFSSLRGNLGRSGGSVTDGVFANLTAKPDSGDPFTEDKPPTYDEAAADATPPYWETTVLAPGLNDELFIEGLPVGSPINFAWNMMVSAAFQFVGFFLTYLLHTSHAAKQGSRAGLGFTLVQCGYYLQPQDGADGSDSDGSSPPSEINPNDPNDISDSNAYSSGFVTYSESSGSPNTAISNLSVDGNTTGWISTILMVIGSLIILKSVADYIQARRMELAILNSSANAASSATHSEELDSEATEVEQSA